MKTMTAKFRGTCAACSGPIVAGTQINFYGRGRAEHVGCEEPTGADEDDRAGFEPGTLATDRALARRGVTVVRFSSGASMTQNSRGRCEDAPCCGCC
jgi:hypothetical protein